MSPRPSVVALLRNGIPDVGAIRPASPDTIRAVPPEMLSEYFGVRLDGPKAAGDLELSGSRPASTSWVPIVTP